MRSATKLFKRRINKYCRRKRNTYRAWKKERKKIPRFFRNFATHLHSLTCGSPGKKLNDELSKVAIFHKVAFKTAFERKLRGQYLSLLSHSLWIGLLRDIDVLPEELRKVRVGARDLYFEGVGRRVPITQNRKIPTSNERNPVLFSASIFIRPMFVFFQRW